MSDTVLKLDNVTKSFGPVEVIKGVDLDVRYGQIQALLGENGAGEIHAHQDDRRRTRAGFRTNPH